MPSHRDTARLESWDRRPLQVGNFQSAQPAPMPTVPTIAGLYTVPSNRKGSLDSATLTIFSLAAGAAADFTRTQLYVGVGGASLVVLELTAAMAIFPQVVNQNVGFAGWMQSGNSLTWTYVGSGAGLAAVFRVGVRVTECDA